MVRVDLEADLLIATGYDRESEPRGQHAVVLQVLDDRVGEVGIPDHERNDRMRPGYGLPTHVHKPLLEANRQKSQLAEEIPPFLGVQDFHRAQRRKRLARGDWVGVDVEGCGLAEEADHRFIAHHVATVDAQSLAEGRNQNVYRR